MKTEHLYDSNTYFASDSWSISQGYIRITSEHKNG